ncbi:MAG: hypothetical protein RMK89_13460 [Armatimonadota bacterium]|nr:hypothetical protein [Armatimonadota bacterium]MDW8144457.1 hypothetical protein [Armatimonadota bacterium]
MRQPVAWWKLVIIVIGLLIILIGAGRWIYQRAKISQPPPPATPEEAQREYQEQVLGYPAEQLTTKQPTAKKPTTR